MIFLSKTILISLENFYYNVHFEPKGLTRQHRSLQTGNYIIADYQGLPAFAAIAYSYPAGSIIKDDGSSDVPAGIYRRRLAVPKTLNENQYLFDLVKDYKTKFEDNVFLWLGITRNNPGTTPPDLTDWVDFYTQEQIPIAEQYWNSDEGTIGSAQNEIYTAIDGNATEADKSWFSYEEIGQYDGFDGTVNGFILDNSLPIDEPQEKRLPGDPLIESTASTTNKRYDYNEGGANTTQGNAHNTNADGKNADNIVKNLENTQNNAFSNGLTTLCNDKGYWAVNPKYPLTLWYEKAI